jgi:hypothetical protein
MSDEYFDSAEQLFWEGHLIRLTQQAAILYSQNTGRDTGYCSACGCWVDRAAHFDSDLRCILEVTRMLGVTRASNLLDK